MSVDMVKKLYASMGPVVDKARKQFGRPLTLAEKILVSHADNFDTQTWERGKAFLIVILALLVVWAKHNSPNNQTCE